MGLIFDIKRSALHMGAGIRTAVFLKGCPLRCGGCCEPEGLVPEAEVTFLERRCTGCGACVDACDQEALSIPNGAPITDRDRCVRCGTCAEVCLSRAREVVGREMTVEAVMEEIRKDRVFCTETGGGATFSGGEPLMQPDFLEAMIRACRAEGIRTAVDTSGFAPTGVMRSIATAADQILYDIKLMDEERHRRYTGVSNTEILDNLRALSEDARAVVVRVPVLPGINDDDGNLDDLGAFIASLSTPFPVDLIPYQRPDTDRYARLDLCDSLSGVQPPSAEAMAAVVRRLERFKLRVTIPPCR